MIEVLWHGRGGQGAFTAARLLGAAASLADGRYALAFPSFGPERRGAPMCAFTKMSDTPIGDRSAIERADYVVYLDETLLAEGWESELKPGGLVLVNSAKGSAAFGDARIATIDADGISQAILGRSIPNTVFLGALAALCPRVSVDDVREAIRQYMAPKLHEKNLRIVDAALAAMEARDPVDNVDALSVVEVRPEVEVSQVEGEALRSVVLPKRPASVIPTLRTGELDPAEYARDTCFTAGYLVAKNAGWRSIRPVVNAERCTGCFQCYLYCPDGTVYKTEQGSSVTPTLGSDASGMFVASGVAPVAIDYDFCKGCGVCATVCKFNALTMVPERGDEAAGSAPAAGSTPAAGSAPAAGNTPAAGNPAMPNANESEGGAR